MKGPAYKLGQMLSHADGLHLEYCRHKRGGSVPPQLLGNALMGQACTNPTRALSQLTDRIRVYQAWARSDQSEGARLAKWHLGQMGPIANDLADAELPSRITDVEKAELLLGYLARSEKKSNADDEENKEEAGNVE